MAKQTKLGTSEVNAITKFHNPYAGVKQASEYLKISRFYKEYTEGNFRIV